MKYNEMENQLGYTRVDYMENRNKRLALEKLQNEVTRVKQSRIQQYTRKLKQATYDLRLVQGQNATYVHFLRFLLFLCFAHLFPVCFFLHRFATEIQLNFHTFLNPISWLLGDKPLFNAADQGQKYLHKGHFEKGMTVWVRSQGESEYRLGQVEAVHADGHMYDILFNDGEKENRVVKQRVRAPADLPQDESWLHYNPVFNMLTGGSKGCGKDCGKCETCCGSCNVFSLPCTSETSGDHMAKRHGLSNHGNYSMRERAAVDP
jgi:hypothetical protein